MGKFLKSLFSTPVILWFYMGYVMMILVLPFSSENEFSNITIFYVRVDYFLHALLFLPWVFFRPAFCIKPGWWLIWGLLFATGSEGIQYILPWRSWNVNDLVANTIGIVIGFIFCILFKVFSKQLMIFYVD